MVQPTDPAFAQIGAHMGTSIQDDDAASASSFDDDDTTGGHFYNPHAPGRYVPTIADSDFTGDGLEDQRRPRFQPSLYGGDSSAASSVADSVFSGRGGNGGGRGSVFSSVHDGRTRASQTESDSVAQRGMNAALLGPVDEAPEIITMEPMAQADISAADHWNQVGVTPMATGPLATSATAIASRNNGGAARPARGGSSGNDATEIVAHLPCELQEYNMCDATFPLHRSEAGIELWTDHIVTKHLHYRYPRVSGCWFCDDKFQIREQDYADKAVAAEVYMRRMKHIARHFIEQRATQTVVRPRRDPAFEAHLVENGIVDPPTGNARVPSGRDMRAPITDRTTGTRRVRSARPEAQYITARPRRPNGGGRQQNHQVVHNL